MKKRIRSVPAMLLALMLILPVTFITCSRSPVAPQVDQGQAEPAADSTAPETPTLAAIASVSHESGVQPSGALYEFYVPDPWNGDVVLYAHGYVNPFEPLAVPDDMIGGTPVHEIVTGLGYAYAATSYRRNGLIIPEAVDDLVELAGIFKDEYPQTNHVLLAGVSEGGAITTLAVENHPDIFDGGLAGCGPVGNFHKQLNYLGEFRLVFDYFFPGVIPGSPVDIPEDVISNWETVYIPQVIAAIQNYPHKTEQLLRVTRAPIDPDDPASVVQTVIGILNYNVLGTNDAIDRLGGQPINNKWKIYTGSDNDFLLNWKIERFRADAAAVAEIYARYQTSGDLHVPLVTLHTTKDEIVPYWHEPLYRWKIFRHRAGLFHSNIPIFRYGHCNFTQSEMLAAFALMVFKVTAHDLFVADTVLPSKGAQAKFLSLAEDYGIQPQVVPVRRQ